MVSNTAEITFPFFHLNKTMYEISRLLKVRATLHQSIHWLYSAVFHQCAYPRISSDLKDTLLNCSRERIWSLLNFVAQWSTWRRWILSSNPYHLKKNTSALWEMMSEAWTKEKIVGSSRSCFVMKCAKCFSVVLKYSVYLFKPRRLSHFWYHHHHHHHHHHPPSHHHFHVHYRYYRYHCHYRYRAIAIVTIIAVVIVIVIIYSCSQSRIAFRSGPGVAALGTSILSLG